MLTLALDTTTRGGSCAVVRDGVVLREDASEPDRPPASRLPGDLMTLLAGCGLSLEEIDVFAVAIGPGSFTGLRIGIATMQGLAFARRRPLIGVSGLAALAEAARQPPSAGRPPLASLAAWVDAWRGEVYAARYELGNEAAPPLVGRPADILRTIDTATLFVGDGAAAHRDEIARVLGERAVFADPLVPRLAGRIALQAGARAERGERPLPGAIGPLYVRRPDAELARERA